MHLSGKRALAVPAYHQSPGRPKRAHIPHTQECGDQDSSGFEGGATDPGVRWTAEAALVDSWPGMGGGTIGKPFDVDRGQTPMKDSPSAILGGRKAHQRVADYTTK